MKAPVLQAGFFLLALTLAATSAKAGEERARLVACYKKDYVEATYDIRHELLKPPVRKYVKRNNRIELLEYPPVYREIKTLKKEAHYVMREIPCD